MRQKTRADVRDVCQRPQTMTRRARWQGQAPRDGILHPVWEPVTSGDPSDEAFVARCLLGAGWVGASRRLSMLDLRVWAALCALLRQQLPQAPDDDPSLANADTRTVQTTGYQLADMVWSTDSGREYAKLKRSLARLRAATVVIQAVESDPELAARQVREGLVGLLGDIWLATTRLDLHTPAQWGALRGSSTLRVELGRWTAQQVLAGRTTWLDLDLLRALGSGVPARLWATLEAWGRWPARSLDEREETAIGLGRPALESLGVAHYHRTHDARRALNRAGSRIVQRDPAYELVRCEQRGGGWCLIVRRISGPRARAQARAGASWRSEGTAARRSQAAERRAIRAQIGHSLDPSAS